MLTTGGLECNLANTFQFPLTLTHSSNNWFNLTRSIVKGGGGGGGFGLNKSFIGGGG